MALLRRSQQRAREALVGQGFTEVLTPSLGDPQKLALTWRLTRGQKSGEPEFLELLFQFIKLFKHLELGNDQFHLDFVGINFIDFGFE